MNKKIIFLDELKQRREGVEKLLLWLFKYKGLWRNDDMRPRVRDVFNWLMKNHSQVGMNGDWEIISALMFFENAPIDEVRIQAHMLLRGVTREEAIEWDGRP